MMTKMFYFDDRFFESNRNFTTKHVKIVKFQVFPGFFQNFLNSRFFLPKLSNSRFTKVFPGKVATVYTG